MNSLKSKSKLLIVLLMVALMGACNLVGEDNDFYTGKATLGFYLPNPPKVDTSKTVSYGVELVRSKEGVLDNSLSVAFTVVDSTTTAPQNSYKIKTTSPVTIPSGSLKTEIVISFEPTAIPSGSSEILEIYLKGNEGQGITGGKNIGLLHVIIEGQG